MEIETLDEGDFEYGVLRQAGASNRPLLVVLGTTYTHNLASDVTAVGLRMIAESNWIVASLDSPSVSDYANHDFVTDPLAPFVAKIVAMRADLISRGIVHPDADMWAVLGVSIGGFLALHSVDSVSTCIGVSPVTKLTALSEFSGWTDPEPAPLDPASFVGKSLIIEIGNADTRVGTENANALAAAIRIAHSGPSDTTFTASPVTGDQHSISPKATDRIVQWLKERIVADPVYTPIVVDSTNVSGHTNYPALFHDNGDGTVSVSGMIDIDPVTTGQAVIFMSMPIDSNFTNTEDVIGGGISSGDPSQPACLFADTNGNRVRMQFNALTGSVQTFTYWYTYRLR